MPKKIVEKKLIKKVAKRKTLVKKAAEVKETVSLPVVDTAGHSSGHVSAPASLFGAKVNKTLLAQAVRVYLSNQRAGGAAVKTRGQVEGSTRKIYRQKGTGRARHGAIRAPIFVGGGIVFGPCLRSFKLNMAKKMHNLALASALTSQLKEGHLKVVDGLEKLTPKTKIMAKTLSSISGSKSTLLILPKDAEPTIRSARNIEKVDVLTANMVSPYSVIAHGTTVVSKNALPELAKIFKA